MRLGVIVPTYNERENIETLIDRVRSAVPDAAVLVVDDKSPDGTAEVVRGIQARAPGVDLLVRAGKLGFRSAYLDGFRRMLQNPSIEAVLMMDADLSHDPGAIPEMIRRLPGHDMVIGSRYTHGGRIDGWGLWRRLLSLFGNMYARTVTGMPIRDCTAGFLLLRRAIVEKLLTSPIEMAGYAFLMELKHHVWQWNMAIAESPITFRDRTLGFSKISNSIIREGIIAPWMLRKQSAGRAPLAAKVGANER